LLDHKGTQMIAHEHLTLILQSPRADVEDWYKKRILLASGLAARAGLRISVEPEEIVSETIYRVLTSRRRYLWDGREPRTFNQFFSQCMGTTANFFAAQSRGQLSGLKKFKAQVICPTSYEAFQEAAQDADSKNRALATAIIKNTRVRGATVDYLDNLHRYVEIGATTKEIAADLNIEKGSVATIRRRLLVRFGEREKG
jgi:hypothetical protein